LAQAIFNQTSIDSAIRLPNYFPQSVFTKFA